MNVIGYLYSDYKCKKHEVTPYFPALKTWRSTKPKPTNIYLTQPSRDKQGGNLGREKADIPDSLNEIPRSWCAFSFPCHLLFYHVPCSQIPAGEYCMPGSPKLARFIPEIIDLACDSLQSPAHSPPIWRRKTSFHLLSYQKHHEERAPGTWNVTNSEDMIKYLNWQNYIPLVTFSTVCSASHSPLPSLPAPGSSSPCGHMPARDLFFPLCSLLNVFSFSTTCPRPSHQLLIKWSMNMQISPHTHFIKLNKKEEMTWHAQQQNRWWGGLLQGRRGRIGAF